MSHYKTRINGPAGHVRGFGAKDGRIEGRFGAAGLKEIFEEIELKYHAYSNAQNAGESRIFVTFGHIGRPFSELDDMKELFRAYANVAQDSGPEDAKYMRRIRRHSAAVIALIARSYEDVRDVSQEIVSMLDSEDKTTRRSGILAVGILAKKGIRLPDSKKRLEVSAATDAEPAVRKEAETTLAFFH